MNSCALFFAWQKVYTDSTERIWKSLNWSVNSCLQVISLRQLMNCAKELKKARRYRYCRVQPVQVKPLPWLISLPEKTDQRLFSHIIKHWQDSCIPNSRNCFHITEWSFLCPTSTIISRKHTCRKTTCILKKQRRSIRSSICSVNPHSTLFWKEGIRLLWLRLRASMLQVIRWNIKTCS